MTTFGLRTLLRSRQHRMVMSFYLGIGFTIVVGYLKLTHVNRLSRQAGISTAFLLASMLMMILTLLAIRVVASIPISLAANWIIRITQVRPPSAYQDAVRFSWMAIGVIPVMLIVTGLVLFDRYPWRPASEHLFIVFALGIVIVETCMYSFPKIPFTCSYLPGKAKIHFVFWACLMLFIRLLYAAAEFEQRVLIHPVSYIVTLFILLSCVVAVRMRTTVRMTALKELSFEERYPAELTSLKLG